MPEGARLDSVSTLLDLKIALWKFQEAANVGLADAEAELGRMLMWVQNEQSSHWKSQIRIRQELVVRAKEAVRMKKIFKDASGRQQSAVDEEKALRVAQTKLAEAEHKLAMVKRWSIQLQKESELYKAGVQRFATGVQSELPKAAAHLDGLAGNIENYLSTQAASAIAESAEAGSASVSRGVETAPPQGPTTYELKLLIASIPEHHREAFTRIDGFGSEPPGEELIWVAEGVTTSESVRIFRLPSQDSKPGSWRVVPDIEGATPASWVAIAADILQQIRPDFAELLLLPSGFSVNIDNSGVALIRDAKERPVWQRGADLNS